MTNLNLKPVVVFHRPNGTNAESEDYRFVCVDSLGNVSAPEGFTELGVAFTCSDTPGTLADGTTLIPLYHKQMTYPQTGGVYDVLVTDDSWQAGTWTTVATYYAFPPDTDRYGATKLGAWNSTEDEKVHWYSTTGETPSGRTWRTDGSITDATVCPVNTVRVLGGRPGVALSTAAGKFVNGRRTWIPGGDINAYPAIGNLLEFKRDASETWTFTKITMTQISSGTTWTFNVDDVGQVGGPFLVERWNDDHVVFRDDNVSASNHGQYKYQVHVQATDGTPYQCDPKVINRSQTTSVQNQHQNPGEAAGA